MKVEADKLVKMDYELAIDGGDVIESSEKTGPLEYRHGDGRMLASLESRIEGLEEGDEKEGVIPAEEAYGREEDLPTREIPRNEFPEGEELEIGKAFEAKGPDGAPVNFAVTAIDDDKVTVRFMHPLAGKAIRFKVKILSVKDPKTPPPIPGS